VHAVGTFNDWRAGSIALEDQTTTACGDTVVLPTGTYEYMFVVDGERWVPTLRSVWWPTTSAAELYRHCAAGPSMKRCGAWLRGLPGRPARRPVVRGRLCGAHPE